MCFSNRTVIEVHLSWFSCLNAHLKAKQDWACCKDHQLDQKQGLSRASFCDKNLASNDIQVWRLVQIYWPPFLSPKIKKTVSLTKECETLNFFTRPLLITKNILHRLFLSNSSSGIESTAINWPSKPMGRSILESTRTIEWFLCCLMCICLVGGM